MGDAFASYTFTDISTGFMEKARQTFAAVGDRMTFRALDIEKDIVRAGLPRTSVRSGHQLPRAERRRIETQDVYQVILRIPDGALLVCMTLGLVVANRTQQGCLLLGSSTCLDSSACELALLLLASVGWPLLETFHRAVPLGRVRRGEGGVKHSISVRIGPSWHSKHHSVAGSNWRTGLMPGNRPLLGAVGPRWACSQSALLEFTVHVKALWPKIIIYTTIRATI